MRKMLNILNILSLRPRPKKCENKLLRADLTKKCTKCPQMGKNQTIATPARPIFAAMEGFS